MSAPVGGPFDFPYTVDPGIVRATSDQIVLPGSNQCVYLRVHGSGRISKVGLWVVASSGNISLAVHRNVGRGRLAKPGARVVTSGAVACPAVGYQEVALGGSVTVRQGDWFALSADNVTAAFRSLLSAQADNDLGKGRQYRQATAHPAPATPGTLVATVGMTAVLVGVA